MNEEGPRVLCVAGECMRTSDLCSNEEKPLGDLSVLSNGGRGRLSGRVACSVGINRLALFGTVCDRGPLHPQNDGGKIPCLGVLDRQGAKRPEPWSWGLCASA